MKVRARALLEATKDRPFYVTLVLLLLVLLHLAATIFSLVPDVWATLQADLSSSIAVYLGLSSGAAILAGFAGVIVMHGLTASSERFRKYRLAAGKTLYANWASISSAGFLSAALSLVAAIVAAGGAGMVGPWIFELALLCAAHGTLRLLWLLRTYFELQGYDDADEHARTSQASLGDLFGDRP